MAKQVMFTKDLTPLLEDDENVKPTKPLSQEKEASRLTNEYIGTYNK